MSYLSLFHWGFSFGASDLVCTVVILFALFLAPGVDGIHYWKDVC